MPMGSMSDRERGLRWARAWRIRHKQEFDAIYGPDILPMVPCPLCGAPTPRGEVACG